MNESQAQDPTESFVRLLTKHERDLYRYIVSLLSGAAEADDVMQDTAIILWKKFGEYDAARPFLPWAFRFAYFEVLKLRRKKGRSRLIFSEELLGQLAVDHEILQPALEVRRAALKECMARLAKEDQTLLLTRYGSSKTIRELARELKTESHRLYYSLERIRASLMDCVSRRMRKEGFDGAV